MSGHAKRALNSIVKHALIYLCLFIVFFPFLWMILASFQTQKDIMNAGKGLLRFQPTLANYHKAFWQHSFGRPIFNSFVIGLMSTGFALVLGLPAAYSIGRFKQRKISMLILLVRMIPGITFLMPWFSIFSSIGLIDTYFAMVLAHMLVALPFIIWIMVPFFEGIPRELEEAAWVDGSSRVGGFARIMLKLSLPGILTASLLAFIYSWNNFMFSLVLSGARTITLPIAIFSFISYASVDWGGLMAASVVITVPILVMSVFLQKYIVGGLTAGAVKS